MTRIHHLNCGYLQVPPHPKAGCHCLLLEDDRGLALIDTGIGLSDVRSPLERVGRTTIDLAGFRFEEADTAVRQIERLGLRPEDVGHIVLTHGDPDHVGGLADFPSATVHVGEEELANITGGSWRYLPTMFSHGPKWRPYPRSDVDWFGLEARKVGLDFASEVLLVPLFGHTHGHCGIAVRSGGGWVLHVGDAYYLRVELETDDHWVSQLAAGRADDDAKRRASLGHLRRLARDRTGGVEMFGYHDTGEMPMPGDPK